MVPTHGWEWNAAATSGVAACESEDGRRREGREHVLLLVMHHPISDEWSTWMLWDDVWALYEGSVEQMKEATGQDWEFAEWEASVLEREGEALREWWRRHLAGTRALQLEGMAEARRRRERGERVRGWRVAVRIPERVRERVAAAARAAGVTAFAVWQGVFAAWAWRHMEGRGEGGSGSEGLEWDGGRARAKEVSEKRSSFVLPLPGLVGALGATSGSGTLLGTSRAQATPALGTVRAFALRYGSLGGKPDGKISYLLTRLCRTARAP